MGNNKQRLFEIMGKVDSSFKPKLNEELGVASDGGYYNKPEHNISVSQSGAQEIQRIVKEMSDGLFNSSEPVSVSMRRGEDELKREILEKMRMSGIKLDYDSEEGEDYYWIAQGQDLNDAKEEFDLITSELYHTIDKSEPAMNEMPNWGRTRANPAYTHFAVLKDSGKIVNGWDYKGYDQAELRQNKKDYFFRDLIDNEIAPNTVNVITAKYLLAHGTNPYDYANWQSSGTSGTDVNAM